MVRFMQPTKVAIGTQDVIAGHVREQTWQRCVFSCQAFMAPTFVIGAKLGSWFDQLLQRNAIQSAQGQLLAVKMTIVQTPSGIAIQQHDFADLCTACGLWVWLLEHVLPLLAFGSDTIEELWKNYEAVGGAESLRTELLALRTCEPEHELVDYTACAEWVLGCVQLLRTAKDTDTEKANKGAQQNPALL